jgi:hypothetical protein
LWQWSVKLQQLVNYKLVTEKSVGAFCSIFIRLLVSWFGELALSENLRFAKLAVGKEFEVIIFVPDFPVKVSTEKYFFFSRFTLASRVLLGSLDYCSTATITA